jgi:hypothetical protein
MVFNCKRPCGRQVPGPRAGGSVGRSGGRRVGRATGVSTSKGISYIVCLIVFSLYHFKCITCNALVKVTAFVKY